MRWKSQAVYCIEANAVYSLWLRYPKTAERPEKAEDERMKFAKIAQTQGWRSTMNFCTRALTVFTSKLYQKIHNYKLNFALNWTWESQG